MSEHDHRLNAIERELTLLSRHFTSLRGPRAGQHLDRSAYVLLTRLETGAPRTLKELAGLFQADVSTINRQVSAMLRAGLVERIPDPDGGIARKFRPTPLGLEQLEADRTLSRTNTARLIETAGWSSERAAQFTALLAEFNRSAEQLEQRALNRPGEDGPAR